HQLSGKAKPTVQVWLEPCQYGLAGFKLAANRVAPSGEQKSRCICVFSQKPLVPKRLRFARSSAPRCRWLDCCTPPTRNFILMLACHADKGPGLWRACRIERFLS